MLQHVAAIFQAILKGTYGAAEALVYPGMVAVLLGAAPTAPSPTAKPMRTLTSRDTVGLKLSRIWGQDRRGC